MQLDGEIRVRPEYQGKYADPGNYSADQGDFISSRVRLGARLKIDEEVAARIDFQTNHLYGQTAVVKDGVRLYQGFIDFSPPQKRWSLKLGRQCLGAMGSELLVGNDDFGPGISFDAVRINHESPRRAFTAWFSQRSETGSLGADDSAFSGMWLTLTPSTAANFDVYALSNRNIPRGVFLRESLVTAGARMHGSWTGALSPGYSLEGVRQFGSSGSGSIGAWAVEASGEITLDLPAKPRARLMYGAASGDAAPRDENDRTFNPLFQDIHPRYGDADLFTLSNMRIVNPKIEFFPASRFSFGTQAVFAAVQEPADIISPANFGAGTNPSAGKFVGSEYDLFFNYKRSKNLTFSFAWARFFPGAYVKDNLRTSSPSDRFYIHSRLTF